MNIYLRKGRNFFFLLVLSGAFLVLSGLAGLLGAGLLERLGLVLAGAGLLAGGGGTLALSYDKIAPVDVVPVRLILRAGFICVGVGIMCVGLPAGLRKSEWGETLGGAVLTFIFLINLVVYIIRTRRE